MRKELDSKLCSDFPMLYRERNLDMMHTCMCWGFPGDGWFDLLYRLSEKLEALIAAEPEEHRPCAVQVKEKFGTLRFYMSNSTDEMEDLIDEAEKESEVTCEYCGKPGRLRGWGWIECMCDGCDSMSPAERMALRDEEYA